MKIVVNFCTRKLNRLQMKVKILVNSSIRKVDSTAFKELRTTVRLQIPLQTFLLSQ